MTLTNYLRAGVKRAFGLHQPGRELVILPDDTFLVSYPKSGNTWVRLLIANLLSPESPADFWTVRRLIPELEAVTKRQLSSMRRPRLIKSHFPFDPRYPRVIYLVRDPRDVVISEYHYQRKTLAIDDSHPIADYVQRFIAGKTCPQDGSWGEHVASWIITREGDPRFLLIRYERLLDDPVPQLAAIAKFLKISAGCDRLRQAVDLSSADRMRRLEALQSNALSVIERGRRDLPFVRAARSGNWKRELAENLADEIETAWAPLLSHLGYELSRRSPRSKSVAASGFSVLRS